MFMMLIGDLPVKTDVVSLSDLTRNLVLSRKGYIEFETS